MKIQIWCFDGKCTRGFEPAFPRNFDIAKEDEEVWAEFLTDRISKLMSPAVMTTPEFIAAKERVQKRREQELRFERQREKERENRQRRKVMDRPRITFIPKGLAVDYEKEYAVFFDQEVTYEPTDSDDFLYQFRLLNRWQEKSVPQIIEMGRPDAAYAIAIELCRHIPLFLNRDDLQEYIRKYKVRIRKMITGSFAGLAFAVRAWNNEEKRRYVNHFIFEEAKHYSDFRGLQRQLIQLMLSDSFTGEPVLVTRQMNDEELFRVRQERRLKELEERARLAEEREAKSMIPLNQEYESSIFDKRFVSWDLTIIDIRVTAEAKRIKALAESGEYQQAATYLLQLTKSMCKHYIEDEHWGFYDDLYGPEYTIRNLVEYFNTLIKQGKLPEKVKDYLQMGWSEIRTYESCTDYGLLNSTGIIL